MTERPAPAEQTSCACLRLRKVTRRVTQIYDQALAPAGLTSTQYSVLAHLQAAADLSIGELADRLVMDPTTLTRALQPLTRQRYVEIVAGRDDRRRRVVALTAEGRAAVRTAVPLWRQAQHQLGRQLGRDGFKTLVASLDRSLVRLTGP